MVQERSPHNMRAFTTIWFGQLISMIGSGLTVFSLGVWVYQETRSATLFALILLFATLPGILLFPVTGVLVDRWDRRRVLLASDSLSALSTLGVVILLQTGHLEIWHIYLVTALHSTANSFQWPAFSAATTMLVPQEKLGRVGGMMQLNEAATGIVAPLLAGFLMSRVSLSVIIGLDFITFLAALVTLFIVHIPQPKRMEAGESGRGSFWQEMTFGWNYIKARPALVSLLAFLTVYNFSLGLAQAWFRPLILTAGDSLALGTVIAVGSIGMFLGSTLMSTWGGPKRRLHGVLGGAFIFGLFIALFGIYPAIPVFIVAAFGNLFMLPIIHGSNQALWLSKVAPEVQGRVFSMRSMLAWSMAPLAFLIAGPLADQVFEPWMRAGGWLAQTVVGQVLGVGPGRGIAVLYVLIGLLVSSAAAVSYLNPRLRRMEDELPSVVVRSADVTLTGDEGGEGESLLDGVVTGD